MNQLEQKCQPVEVKVGPIVSKLSKKKLKTCPKLFEAHFLEPFFSQ